jgi:hypothetical protein
LKVRRSIQSCGRGKNDEKLKLNIEVDGEG